MCIRSMVHQIFIIHVYILGLSVAEVFISPENSPDSANEVQARLWKQLYDLSNAKAQRLQFKSNLCCEVNELKEQVSNLRTCITELDNKIKSLEGMWNRLINWLCSSEEKKNQDHRLANDYRKQIKDYEEEISSLTNRINERIEKEKEVSREITDLESQNYELREKMRNSRELNQDGSFEQLRSIDIRVAGVSRELSDSRRRLSEKEKELEDFRKRERSNKKEIYDLRSGIVTLRTKIDRLEKEVDSLDEQAYKLREQISYDSHGLSDRTSDLEQLSRVNKRAVEASRQMRSLKKQARQKENEAQNLHEITLCITDMISLTHDEINALRNQIAKLEQKEKHLEELAYNLIAEKAQGSQVLP